MAKCGDLPRRFAASSPGAGRALGPFICSGRVPDARFRRRTSVLAVTSTSVPRRADPTSTGRAISYVGLTPSPRRATAPARREAVRIPGEAGTPPSAALSFRRHPIVHSSSQQPEERTANALTPQDLSPTLVERSSVSSARSLRVRANSRESRAGAASCRRCALLRSSLHSVHSGCRG